MSSIVYPVHITYEKWTSQIQQDLSDIVVPIAGRVEDWQEWANQLITVNELADVPLATRTVFPNPEDWRKWARYFVETVLFIN